MSENVVERLIAVRGENGKAIGTKLVKLEKYPVVILTPHKTEFDYRECRNWLFRFLLTAPKTNFAEVTGWHLAEARTMLVDAAMKTSMEYLFFLDDDVIPPPDVLTALLSHQKPIVCGIYWTRDGQRPRPAAGTIKGDGPSAHYTSISLNQKKRLVEVDWAGLGCALIHRNIFERISKPWFELTPGHSEDCYFFNKVARETGIKPLIDLDMKCRHVGVFSIEPDGTFKPPWRDMGAL